jgi:hypothetical protein
MSDTDLGVRITFHVFRKLFPEQDPTKYVEFLMRNLNDEMVALGMMAGGQQYLDFQKPQREGDVAMGLARFILEDKT